jgi:Arc/MetJ-type ribon-helix-helix transcriptional regulator
LESSIQAAVHNGRFASVDDAMAHAARLLLQELDRGEQQANYSVTGDTFDPVLGCMRDDAALMDEIVADAYRHREDETWRDLDI